MFAAILRDYSPNLVAGSQKYFFQQFNRLFCWCRPVGQGNDGGIAAPVEYLFQPSLQGTELSLFRVRVADQITGMGIHNGRQILLVLTSHHDHEVCKRLEHADSRCEKCFAAPWQQGLVSSHAGRSPGSQDYAGK